MQAQYKRGWPAGEGPDELLARLDPAAPAVAPRAAPAAKRSRSEVRTRAPCVGSIDDPMAVPVLAFRMVVTRDGRRSHPCSCIKETSFIRWGRAGGGLKP